MTETLSVVIPALNEEDGIGDIIRRVLAVETRLREVGIEDLEVIVVDDGSVDHTPDVVAGFHRVRLVRHASNCGYGAALKTGFSVAVGSLLAFLDADGTYPAERLPDLCQAAIAQGADLVIGSRMMRAHPAQRQRAGAEGSREATDADGSAMPRVRRIGNRVFAGLLSVVGNARISDSASGMRVLRRRALDYLYPLPDGLHFTPTMSTRALHEQLRMVEVPIPYHERVGRSKLSAMRDGARFLRTILWTALGYNPVRVLGLAGLGALAVSGAIGLALLLTRLQGIDTLGPWGVFGVFAALVLAVAGASTFALGATFGHLVGLFHKHPVRQGLLGRPIFDPPLERQFGWLGLTAGAAGVLLGVGTLLLGLSGWPVSRVWLYQLGSALLILVGLQLATSWLLMRVLEELSQRDELASRDRAGRASREAALHAGVIGSTGNRG